MCSYSTQGITLDATLRCRPAGLTRSRLQCAPGACFGLQMLPHGRAHMTAGLPYLHSMHGRGEEHFLVPLNFCYARKALSFAHCEAATCAALEDAEQSRPWLAQDYSMSFGRV